MPDPPLPLFAVPLVIGVNAGPLLLGPPTPYVTGEPEIEDDNPGPPGRPATGYGPLENGEPAPPAPPPPPPATISGLPSPPGFPCPGVPLPPAPWPPPPEPPGVPFVGPAPPPPLVDVIGPNTELLPDPPWVMEAAGTLLPPPPTVTVYGPTVTGSVAAR